MDITKRPVYGDVSPTIIEIFKGYKKLQLIQEASLKYLMSRSVCSDRIEAVTRALIQGI